MVFLDGECPKCGGDTHGYSFDEPMVCAQCGEQVPVCQEDADMMNEVSGKSGPLCSENGILGCSNEEIYQRIARLERERDAAVADMERGGKCPNCKFGGRRSQITGLAICDLCYEYPREGCFVWRGPQDEK